MSSESLTLNVTTITRFIVKATFRFIFFMTLKKMLGRKRGNKRQRKINFKKSQMQQHVVNRIKKGGAGGGVDHFSINRNVEWQRGAGPTGAWLQGEQRGCSVEFRAPQSRRWRSSARFCRSGCRRTPSSAPPPSPPPPGRTPRASHRACEETRR